MEALNLQDGEVIRLKVQVQLVKGYPQTVGDLFLTDRRLVLLPNQVLSIGFGKRWEIKISDIQNLETKKPFQGGPYVGMAGKRLVIILKDNSKHILSALEDLTPLYEALSEQVTNKDFPDDVIAPKPTSPSISTSQSPVDTYNKPPEVISQPGAIFPSNPPKDPILAALLSFLFAGGAGQIYLGQVKKGIAIIVVSIVFSCVGVGFITWMLGVVDAYLVAKRLQSGNSVGEMQFF
jgi:TM2 domain-containing membrane protein YozV